MVYYPVMISQVLICQDHEQQVKAALELLENLNLSKNHPDVLWLDAEETNLGMGAAKQVIDHFTLKPYQAAGRSTVIIGAQTLTAEAQNSLLKTLEEPPKDASLIMISTTEDSLLSTILSRCQISRVNNPEPGVGDSFDVEKILEASLEERFAAIEKTEDKEGLLTLLMHYFSQKLRDDPSRLDGAKLLLEAEKWQKANGNTRAILEYLMLEV